MKADQINVSLLPFILQEMVDLIGLPLTMKLVEKYPGVRLYVPKLALADDHALVELLGRAPTEKLQRLFGGEPHFDVPKAYHAMLAVRNAEIRGKRPRTSVRLLALEYRLTEKQIRNICGEMEDDRQVSLF
jgi:Mor family transcriptional regulator